MEAGIMRKSHRSALLALLVSILIVAGALLAPHQSVQAQSGQSCRVSYRVVSQGSTWFQGGVTITNTGTSPINGWSVAWSFANNQSIFALWSGVYTQTGTAVTVGNAAWNASIPAGGSQSFGFMANYSSPNSLPSAFTVNGQPCTP